MIQTVTPQFFTRRIQFDPPTLGVPPRRRGGWKDDPAGKSERLNLQQVCATVGRSDETLRRWIKAGDFPRPIKVGSKLLWPAEEIHAWQRANGK